MGSMNCKHDSHVDFLCTSVGQEIRDRFSGAVEAFSRRNGSGHGLHGDQSRHRSSDDVPSSKDVVCSCMLQYAIFRHSFC